MNKRKGRIVYELLRRDAVIAANVLAMNVEYEFSTGKLNEEQRNILKSLMALAMKLKSATHIVIHDIPDPREDDD